MRKQVLFCAILGFMMFAVGCSSVSENSQLQSGNMSEAWINEPLSSVQAEEQYGDFYSAPESAESIMSTAAGEFFAEVKQDLIDKFGEDNEYNGMYKIYIDDIRIYPAYGGVFAVYGFRFGGALDAIWYDIHFVNSDSDETIYSGKHYISDIHTIGNGEKLFLLWNDGELSSMDKTGKAEQLCKVTPPNDDAEIYGMLSKLSGSGSEITAEVAFVNQNEDGSHTGIREKVVFDLTTGSISSQEQSELDEI